MAPPPVNPFKSKSKSKKDPNIHSPSESFHPPDSGSRIGSFREEDLGSTAQRQNPSSHVETIETIPPSPPPKPSSRTPLGLFRKWSRSSERVKDTAPSIHDDHGGPYDYDDDDNRGGPTIDPETGFQMVGPPSVPPKDPQTRSRNPLRLFRTKSREKQDDPVFADTHRDSSGVPLFADSPTDMDAPVLPAPAALPKGRNPLALFRRKSREPKPEGAEESGKGWPERAERALDITWSGDGDPSRPTGGSRGLNPLRLFKTKSREQDPAAADAPGDGEGEDPTLAEDNVEEAVNPLGRTRSRGINPLRLFRSKSREQDLAPVDAPGDGEGEGPALVEDNVEEAVNPLGRTRSRGMNPLRLFKSKSREQDLAPADAPGDDEGEGPALVEDNVEEAVNPLGRTRSRGMNPLRLFRSKSREQEPPESLRDEAREQPQPPEEPFEYDEEATKPLGRKGSLRRNLFGGLFRPRSPEDDLSDSLQDEEVEGGSILAQDELEHFEQPSQPRTRKGSLRRNLFGGLFRSESPEQDAAPEDEGLAIPGDQSRAEYPGNVDEQAPSRSARSRGLNPLGLFRSKSREHNIIPADDDIRNDEGPRIAGDQPRFEIVENVDEQMDQARSKRSRGLNPLALFRSKSREQDPVFLDDSRDVEGPISPEEAIENLEDPVNQLCRKGSGGRYPFGIFRSRSRGQDPAGMATSESNRAGDGYLLAEDPSRLEYVGSVEDPANAAPPPSRKRKPLGLLESSPKTREQEYGGRVDDTARDDLGPKLAEDQVQDVNDAEEHANSQPSPASLVEVPWYEERSGGPPMTEEQPRFEDLHNVEEPVDSRPPPKKKRTFRLFRSKSRDQDLPEIPRYDEEGEEIFAEDGSRVDHAEEAANPPRPKKKRSFGLFRSKSRDQGIPESDRGAEGGGGPTPAEDQAEYVDRGEGAASPLRRKPSRGLSLGLFKSRSRDPDTRSVQGERQTEGSIRTLEDVHGEEAINPLRPKRSLSLNPLRLFRTKSRDQETGSVRSQQQSGEGGSIMLADAPSGRGSPYSQPQGRSPFRLFRKKSRGEPSAADVAGPGDGTSVHFADGPSQGSLASAKAKKGGWRGILKRRKSEPAAVDPPVEVEVPELYPTRSNSPAIERQRLSIDPVHLQQNDDDSLYRHTLNDEDGPPPVVNLMTPEASPRQALGRIASPGAYPSYQQQQYADYEAPPTSILADGRPRKPAVAGVTHITPQDHVFKVVHENGNIAPAEVSVGKPVQIGNYRISVRPGDDDDDEEEAPQGKSYPTRQQRDASAGPAYPGQTTAEGAHVFLKPGDEYEIPPDGNVVFVVDEDVQLEIGDPETGVFVPYDDEYIRSREAQKQEAYEETYIVPPGKFIEFQDEEGRVLHRTGGPKDTSAGMQDLGNGTWGGYQSDGSYLLQVGGPSPSKAGNPQKPAATGDYAAREAVAPRPPPSASPRNSESLQYEASHQSPNTLHTPPSSPSPHLTGSPMRFSSVGELITELTMDIKKNLHWKPHGPMDYARSVRKWNIQPTEYTKLFCHEGGLFKKLMDHELKFHERATSTPSGAPRGAPSAPSGGARLSAQDVQNDLEYVVPVTVGTPPQVVNLDFDTGSADLWVWSTLLNTSPTNLKGHGIYNPRRSSTAKLAPGLKWKITYGDSSGASGTVYRDVVRFSNLAIPDQAVEVAAQLSSTFLGEHGSDGLLGLAFPTINTITPTKQKTPVQQLVEQGIIKQPIFVAKLDKGGTGSFYTFGYIPHNVLPASSHIIYSNVDSSHGFWEFPSPQLRVGRQTVNRRPGNTAIADTGTTLILLDDAALDVIYRPISGARLDHSGWILPTKSRVPDISFSVAGTFFAISGEDLKFADAGGGMSFGSIQSRGQNRQDILGDVFLKRVLTVFDQTPGHPRIGFGQRAFN